MFGWARVRNAANKVFAYGLAPTDEIDEVAIAAIPGWNSADFVMSDDRGWLGQLESYDVFLSAPLGHDFLTMTSFGDQHDIAEADLEAPDAAMITQVHGNPSLKRLCSLSSKCLLRSHVRTSPRSTAKSAFRHHEYVRLRPICGRIAATGDWECKWQHLPASMSRACHYASPTMTRLSRS